ncbi:penicillin-binding protein 1C [Dysgonomonas sp. 25]|uniref:penicillin-binding protein 1C n=1 Tax=Dysgonomonas sp. 25 TaxID=2302933 RepID=UPI0013D79A0B|nr:penicillin-binding protein 1C [Dysgonomonas sp. 25]NDV69835.1 penicillin-binding protein 1C [Dysgonomonas sp. 25]
MSACRDNIKNRLRAIWKRYCHSKKRYKVGIPVLLVFVVWYIFCLPDPLFNVPYSTVVSDRNGELLGARIAKDQQWRFPMTDSIPEKYKICLVEFEDKHFHRHWGVNPLAIGRALVQNIEGDRIVSGASTITMQTIRLSRNKDRTITEKLYEAILATRLEFACSKDEILQLYASHAPMGGNVVGINAASWRYFGHDASYLSWSEAATLAVLPNAPSLMHFGRNRDKLLSKRNRLLKRIFEKGLIGEIDYELAIAEPLPYSPHSLPQTAPHLVTKIYLEEGGKQVTSTIDKYQQERVENILERWNAEFAQNGINNIAAVVFDVQTNEVAAYCGNVHFERNATGSQVDVIQAPRSTGSILKPILYCSMLDNGQILPNQLLPDIPVDLYGFMPKNYSQKYDGGVPASSALARSLNVPFVLCLKDYGVSKFVNLLKRSGMTTLKRSNDNYGLSLVLGGAEGKLWEISYMYLQMAQTLQDFNVEGKYYQPVAPSYILNEEKSFEEESNPLFSAGAIWQTFEALTTVHRPEEIDWQFIPSIQKIAWKTGTSFGSRDAWSVGITPKYVVGVWVGNADGEGRPGIIGSKTAGMVMFDIFNALPQSQWFDQPEEDLVEAHICQLSGHLKSINCPDEDSEWTRISPKGFNGHPCPYHKRVHLSEDKQYQVYEDCAGKRGIVHLSWFSLPPLWEKYYKEHNTSYKPLPPYSPECRTEEEKRLMEFVYPYPNSILSLPKQLDGSEGRVVFEIAHRIPTHRVFWHIDNEYIGETRNFHKKEYTPAKGEHKLTVVDETGSSISMKFLVQ